MKSYSEENLLDSIEHCKEKVNCLNGKCKKEHELLLNMLTDLYKYKYETKLYKLIVYFTKKENIHIPIDINNSNLKIKGENLTGLSTQVKYGQESIFIGTNKNKLLEKLERLKLRNSYRDYVLEEIKLEECLEL